MKKFNMKKSVLAVAVIATFTTTNAANAWEWEDADSMILGGVVAAVAAPAVLVGGAAAAVTYGSVLVAGAGSMKYLDEDYAKREELRKIQRENAKNGDDFRFRYSDVLATSDLTPAEIKGLTGFVNLGMADLCKKTGKKGERWASLDNYNYNLQKREAIKYKDNAAVDSGMGGAATYMHGGIGGVIEKNFNPRDEESGYIHRKMQSTRGGFAHYGFSCNSTVQEGTMVIEGETDGTEIFVNKNHEIRFRQGRAGYSFESVSALIPLDTLLKMTDKASSQQLPAY